MISFKRKFVNFSRKMLLKGPNEWSISYTPDENQGPSHIAFYFFIFWFPRA